MIGLPRFLTPVTYAEVHPMAEKNWMNRRQRLIHMTIRDVDCADFDVEHVIETFRRWNVTCFSFFAGGYVTTYPTKLPWQRVSPYLGDRDLCGEIIEAAHAADMRAFTMIDLGEVPVEVAEEHPDWLARRRDGSFYVKTDGIVTSCPLGDYVRECSRQVVAELLERYDMDGMKFGGASYGFAPGVCHCDRCRQSLRNDRGLELPEDREDDRYAAYMRWREEKMKETVRYLVDVVHQQADIPVVGNSVRHLGRGMSIDDLARDQDFVQLEVQTRTHPTGPNSEACWERFTFPTETCRYAGLLSRRPPWVVASYFLAWPWRRVAVPPAEQKLYLAQVAANGCSPMVNLSGGPPKVHQDTRGFRAIEELYGFMARNNRLYEGDRSGATVAILYCHDSARLARRQPDSYLHYLADLHGCEDALNRAHIPFDIVNTERLEEVGADDYAALLLPGATALTSAAARELTRLVEGGAGLVATDAPATRDAQGTPRGRSPLAALLGVIAIGEENTFLESPHKGLAQAYGRPDAEHALFADIDAELVPLAGPWYAVEAKPGVEVPMVRTAPFRVFPEGLSYPDYPDPAEPLAVIKNAPEQGRTVYFPFPAGRCAARTGHPDNKRLISNAVRHAARGDIPVGLEGHPDVLVTLRLQRGRKLIHLVNTTGRERYLEVFTPVRGLNLTVRSEQAPDRAWRASTGDELDFEYADGVVRVLVPELVDYDIVALENSERKNRTQS